MNYFKTFFLACIFINTSYAQANQQKEIEMYEPVRSLYYIDTIWDKVNPKIYKLSYEIFDNPDRVYVKHDSMILLTYITNDIFNRINTYRKQCNKKEIPHSPVTADDANLRFIFSFVKYNKSAVLVKDIDYDCNCGCEACIYETLMKKRGFKRRLRKSNITDLQISLLIDKKHILYGYVYVDGFFNKTYYFEIE